MEKSSGAQLDQNNLTAYSLNLNHWKTLDGFSDHNVMLEGKQSVAYVIGHCDLKS